jgi:hypothetical protein
MDVQVDAERNLRAIEAALKEAGNKDVTIREFPNLNHLFQTCQTGAGSGYGAIVDAGAGGAGEGRGLDRETYQRPGPSGIPGPPCATANEKRHAVQTRRCPPARCETREQFVTL